ncbi:hypothetical protein GCM10022252_36440 [Streptosporangium oxazolinicum]|uniref:Uncharacterized protein n=1 Tax=Streptosporangium oxazolinicum TaxID=909287 RepID=A0ABP8AY92_9ACTN
MSVGIHWTHSCWAQVSGPSRTTRVSGDQPGPVNKVPAFEYRESLPGPEAEKRFGRNGERRERTSWATVRTVSGVIPRIRPCRESAREAARRQ